MISTTFTISAVSYFALINIGFTHSYVSYDMANELGIWVEEIVSNVTVLSLLGQLVHAKKIYKRCRLQVQSVVFLVDLMEFPFVKFDLILGMD